MYISAFWDFLPTAAELAGVKTPAGLDGISYVPTLLGNTQKKHDHLYWNIKEKGGKRAVRKGDWKLIYFNKSKATELYNLKEDIGEATDLAPKYPEKVKDLFTLIQKSDTAPLGNSTKKPRKKKKKKK